MANETFAWLIRFKEIEREYRATRLATDYLLQSLHTGAVNLEGDLKLLDINRASERLEATCIASLFSEFERGLKRFLRAQKLKKIPRDAQHLINRVAARVGISGDPLQNVHKVRRYRNKLVHHLTDETEEFTVRQATSHLCIFFDRLRTAW
jgi:hypothetical protein